MEFDLLRKPHPHPLMFYQNGRPDRDGIGQNQNIICCSKCQQPWRPPAFGCLDCNFLIHQSCIDLPFEIHTPFHSHHQRPLSLTTNSHPCNCCGQIPFHNVYRCLECRFQIDVPCAIAAVTKAASIRQMTRTGEFHHFSHPHPLTLLQHHQRTGNTKKKIFCHLCQTWCIKPGPTYFCCLCDSHFHPYCAEKPRHILNPDVHNHPLFLFALPFVNNTLCDNCKDEFNGFYYGCAQCNFNLHLQCVSSFRHKHDFKHLKKVASHKCQVCGKLEDGVDWCCSICNLLAHEQCTELPSTPPTSSQQNHPVEPTYEDDPNNPMSNLENGILHFSHEHELTLHPFQDNKHCNGCMQCISTQSYGCTPPCDFFLHEECARLPRQYTNSLLHAHELSMVYIPNFVFSCAVCLQYCQGFAYYCAKCHYIIDIRCAVLILPFQHPSHPHPLSYLHVNEREITYRKWCNCCRKLVRNKAVFRCNVCEFCLDAGCAQLPFAVRNRFDEHPLRLTFVNYNDKEDNEYYCDICEEEIKNKWFYSCKLCYFAAHINCVLGDYPFLKLEQFKGHQHPLSLVKVGKKGHSPCGRCDKSCKGNLAFECAVKSCKFSVHAFGPCYNHKLAQGQITFTMPSLRYCSIPLYLDPIQRKRSKPILLGPNGGRGRGSTWNNERILLAIRQFMVDHERWVDTIQIQFLQNEKSFGSSKHCQLNDEDFKSKKHEDVGRKVVMSLGQHGGVEGDRWDDGVFTSIKQVEISHGQFIHSIQTEYYDGNGVSMSMRHGIQRGKNDKVELKYPDEYLISIYGCTTSLVDMLAIGTLTLESNKRIFGPFGKRATGTRFWFPIGHEAKIVGFHGRCVDFLTSIGVKVVPIHKHSS